MSFLEELQLQVPPDKTQAEIEAAVIDCLLIFAARGRALRQQREKLANASKLQETGAEMFDCHDRNSTGEKDDEDQL